MADKFPFTSRYQSGFSNGVEVLGENLPQMVPGNVYWVSATDGSDGNKGSRSKPFATLSKAIDTATTKQGDMVYLAPGHKETITDALDVDKVGLSVVGLGRGGQRATLLLDSATTTDGIDINAADVTFANVIVKSGTSDMAAAFDVNSAGFTAKNVSIRDNATHENFLIGFDVANAADDVSIEGCDYYTATDSHTAFVNFAGDIKRLKMVGNSYVIGPPADAAGAFLKASATDGEVQALDMGGNVIQVTTTATDSYPLIATTLQNANSGMIYDNRIGTSISNSNATSNFLVKATGFRYAENYQSGAAGHGGSLHPTATN
jgi:hypothetical protein